MSCCNDLVNSGFRGTLCYCTLHLKTTFHHYRDSLRKSVFIVPIWAKGKPSLQRWRARSRSYGVSRTLHTPRHCLCLTSWRWKQRTNSLTFPALLSLLVLGQDTSLPWPQFPPALLEEENEVKGTLRHLVEVLGRGSVKNGTAIAWMNLGDLMLSVISQTQKDRFFMIPLIWST